MNIVTGAVACVAIGIVLTALDGLRRRKPSNLPDGPSGSWLVGNLGDFLSEYQWKKFAAWSKTYGDILYLTVFGRPVIILNKFEDAREIMDRRGAIYSDRTRMVYIVDVLKIRSATFMPYGDTWRAHRRLMQQYLNTRAVAAFRPFQVKCILSLLDDLLMEPDAFWKHGKRFVASAVLSATYGYTVERGNDPLVELNTRSEKAFVRFGPPGATLVDFFPLFRYVRCLPGTVFRTLTEEAREALQEMCTRPYDMVKKQRVTGAAGPSLLSRMLDECERQGISDAAHHEDIKDVCGSMYRAGVGTTYAVLNLFILAMTLHPHVAKKAQKELDTVLNGERLPTFEDQDSLPYIGCIMKECMRWAPPFPLGIGHRAMEEGELEGKRIPKGSLVMPNIWQMMHDERNYDQPEIYNPDRFLKSSDGASSILDPTAAVFGFGRRICPGRHFAEASLWLAMASILTVFDILPSLDGNGCELLPKAEFIPRLNSWSLKEFSCRFVPRSEKAAELVKNAE